MEDYPNYSNQWNQDNTEPYKNYQSKFSSTAGASFYSERASDVIYGEDPVEKYKKRILKKTIASVPSLDKDIRNALLMSLSRGPRANNEELQGRQLEMAQELRDKLLHEAKRFMDTDNAEELKDLLHRVIIQKDSSYNTILKVVKLYLVSNVEKNYVDRIDEEIQSGLKLEDDIKDISARLKEEKQKKSKTKPVKENIASQLRLIEQYENKIEKANQKLNEKMAKNNDVRQKIDQLRKDNLVLEEVHTKLEDELKAKQERVEQTIQNAGYAYIKRNEAEKDLKELKEEAIQSKIEFEVEMEKIKNELQEVEKFKEFINGKTKEKKELESLKAAIAKTKKRIEEKEKSNALMEKEYNLSAKKEEEIKSAFEKIMEKTGIKKPEDLLIVFNTLYEKNQTMENFVKELNEEIEDLNSDISKVKQQIQNYSVKGATTNNQKRKEKTDIIKKLAEEDKKKKLYKVHYSKLIETLNVLKDIIEKVFISIGADDEMVAKVRNSALTEDNMVEFIGFLEQKGINLVAEYSRLLAEQIKLERGDLGNNIALVEDINNLNNIIAYENANILLNKANAPHQTRDFPEEILTNELPIDKDFTYSKDNILSPEQFQQLALGILNAPNRKQVQSSQIVTRTTGQHKSGRQAKSNTANKSSKK